MGYDGGMGDHDISSRTPEGPLGYCQVCRTHSRIEPSVNSLDATCPRCGSLLWFKSSGNVAIGALSARGVAVSTISVPEIYWEPGTRPKYWIKASHRLATEDIRALEVRLSIRLPRLLTRALATQNGGRLLGTNIDIYPAEIFTTLNDGQWVDLAWLELPDSASRERMVCIGTGPGGSVVLDYRHRTVDPTVRIMDHIFDGEVRAEFGSLELMVRTSQQRHSTIL